MSDSRQKKENTSLPVDLAKDIISLQKQEVEVRKQELALRSKELENSHEYALKALDAQKRLYEKAPTERRKDRWQLFWIAAFAFVLISGFFIYLFYTGNGEFAKEIIKYLIGAIFGGSAGYGIGTRKVKEKNQEPED